MTTLFVVVDDDKDIFVEQVDDEDDGVVVELFAVPDDDCGRPVRWVKPNILLLNLLNRFDAILAIPYKKFFQAKQMVRLRKRG